MLRLVLLVSLIGSYFISYSQGDPYYLNSFRFSQSQVHGSARTLGFAGAQTALGADLGSLSSNPAGLGFYRKSEFSFAPNLSIINTNSTAPGYSIPDRKVVFNVNNLGVAFCGLKDDIVESKWRGGTFAFGLTRTTNFQNSSTYRGTTNNSIADYITRRANSEGFDWTAYDKNNPNGLLDIAYGSFLFSPKVIGQTDLGKPIYSTTSYYSLQPPTDTYGETQYGKQETIEEKGGMNEWTAAYGGNYNNKFYFGANLALVKMRYDRINSYHETALNNLDVNNITTDISLNETLKVRGTGVNIGIGVNYVFNDVVRVGASIKSPTYMGINETYNASMTAKYANLTLNGQPQSGQKSSNTSANKYNLSSPLTLNGGLAVFLGKAGFLTGDIEYLDYSSSFIGGKDKTQYILSNQSIKTTYQSVVNLRFGAEFRASIMRFRFGYALYASPYNMQIPDYDRRIRTGDMQTFTAGLGVRTNEFFLDAAVGITHFNSNYSPYINPNAQDDLKISTTNVLNNITIGGGIFF